MSPPKFEGLETIILKRVEGQKVHLLPTWRPCLAVEYEASVSPEIFGSVANFAPNKALELIAWGKLTFDERVVPRHGVIRSLKTLPDASTASDVLVESESQFPRVLVNIRQFLDCTRSVIGNQAELDLHGLLPEQETPGFHLQTLIIYKLGINENYCECEFTLILLIRIVPRTKFL